MIKILNMLITYALIFGVWIVLLYAPIKVKALKKSKLLIFGLIIMLISLISNVIYTGIMGWNYLPESPLESLLDTISFVVWMFGLMVYYAGFNKVKGGN